MAHLDTKFITKFRVNLGSEYKNKKLYNSLRELVVILFAVVFGVGLKKISDAETTLDYVLLTAVYIAILQSWWGYNLGVIGGPTETNKLCYAIDVILLVLYWFIINKAFNLIWVLRLFTIMFLLYIAWEAIRWKDIYTSDLGREKAKQALYINLKFFGIFFILLCSIYFVPHLVPNIVYPFIIIAVTTVYRLKVGKIYSYEIIPDRYADEKRVEDSDRKLIIEAREAAKGAKAHISNYKVGAAIITVDGRIYTGCNIEFDNYSNTLHAEEVAIGSMVKGGSTKPIAIAVYTTGTEITYPCGMCLQSLYELGGEELIVIACNENDSQRRTMADLLPYGFRLEHDE